MTVFRGNYAYRASKTALNMLSVAMKKEGVEDNISFLILHPGWVKTRMGGENAPVELEESVAGMLELIWATKFLGRLWTLCSMMVLICLGKSGFTVDYLGN